MKAVMILILILSSLCLAGTIVPWGNNEWGQCDIIPEGNDFIDIGLGEFGIRGAALKADGTIIDWGFNYNYGYVYPPEGNSFVDIEVSGYHGLALDSNGFIYSWGYCTPELHNISTEGGWTKIATGLGANVAYKPDGTLRYWGGLEIDPNDPNNFPVDGHYKDIKANIGILALKDDGTLIAWGGYRNYDLINVPSGKFKAIGCGYYHHLAIRADGTLAAWGRNDYGQCNVPDGNDYVEVTGGLYRSIARKSDGSIIQWGRQDYPDEIPIPELLGTVKIAAGMETFLALTSESEFTLTLNVEPAEIKKTTPDPGVKYCYAGEKILINAPRCPLCPDVWFFDYWSGDAATKEQTQYISMTGNKIVTAHYKKLAKVCGDECHPILQGDMNKDCYINFEDFAIYSTQWLACTHPDCD